MNNFTCPRCGKKMTVSEKSVKCENDQCGFSLSRYVANAPGVSVTKQQLQELLLKGQTDWIPFSEHGCSNPMRLFLCGGDIMREFKYRFLNGKCPVCGGAVMVTSKGYACYHNVTDKSCSFRIAGILSHRKISIPEAEDFINGRQEVLDGFTSDKGILFSGILKRNDINGIPYVDSVVEKCPMCGGKVHAGPSFYACENFRNPTYRCTFKVYREISHHAVSVRELKEICHDGQTQKKVLFFKEDGTSFRSRLGLAENGQTIFT